MGEPLRVQVSHQALPPALVACCFATRRFGQPGSVGIGLDLTAGPHFGKKDVLTKSTDHSLNDVRLIGTVSVTVIIATWDREGRAQPSPTNGCNSTRQLYGCVANGRKVTLRRDTWWLMKKSDLKDTPTK